MKLKKEELPVAVEIPVATFRATDWDAMGVAYVELKAGADATPLLAGLKDDRCQCPHWGYMITGAIKVTYTNGEVEICKAGEVFYWPSGHTVSVEEDTTFVEFSPKKELNELYAHVGKVIASAS